MENEKTKSLPDAPLHRRVPAFLLDIFLYSICCSLIASIIAAPLANMLQKPVEQEVESLLADMYSGGDVIEVDELFNSYDQSNGRGIAIFLVVTLVVGVIYFAYIPTKMEGRTFGKKAMNLRIITNEGELPLFSQLVLRNVIGYIASTLLFLVGFLVALIFENRRTLHDYIAGTRVIIAGRKVKHDD